MSIIMPRKQMLVQFTHPGQEHVLNKKERKTMVKEWNYGPHRRKFLKAKGQIVNDSGLSAEQEILFWGEWEPTSWVQPILKNTGKGVLPAWIHTPFLQFDKKGRLREFKKLQIVGESSCIPRCNPSPQSTPIPQNTDPFVFAQNFYYCCCKQGTFTQLKSLEKGSIILFGSTFLSAKFGGPCFALDTVFVVSEYRNYTPGNYGNDLNGFVPNDYGQIMGFDLWKKNLNFTCYKSANYQSQVDGMYSFVPCKTLADGLKGFQRVILTDKDLSVITNDLNSAPSYTPCDNKTLKKVWETIRDIVKYQGFKEGMNFEYVRT